MSNTNITMNNVTINAENAPKVINPARLVRDALITSAEQGNKKAITAMDAAYAGIKADEFSKWTRFCDLLRNVAIEYGKAVESKDSTDDQIALAKGRVVEVWGRVLAGDSIHPNMFGRENDADTIRVYAYNMATMSIEGIGTIGCVTPMGHFRRMVETFIGLRFRANEALNDADRDVIQAVLSARSRIKSADERIKGTEKKDGTRVKGLNELLADTINNYNQSLQLLAGFGIDKDTAEKNPAVATLLANKKEYEKQIADANKTITDANKVIVEKQAQYDRIIATINKIEHVAK